MATRQRYQDDKVKALKPLIPQHLTHKHRCKHCRKTWEHADAICFQEWDERMKEHTCPKCGKLVWDILEEKTTIKGD